MSLSASTGPSRKRAAEMFNKISPTYDKLNALLSFGIDKYWRWQTARRVEQSKDLKILDCATGTGDQLFALLRKAHSNSQGIGLDPASNMLEIARVKSSMRPYAKNCQFIEGKADCLPFPDQSFDLLTMSFGIRNVEDVPLALAEMRRVLKPGGKMLILEFALPSYRIFRELHLFYLRQILPKIGRWISGDDTAYVYLANTITTFPHGQDFCNLINEAGFSPSQYHSLTLGIVNLYVATNR